MDTMARAFEDQLRELQHSDQYRVLLRNASFKTGFDPEAGMFDQDTLNDAIKQILQEPNESSTEDAFVRVQQKLHQMKVDYVCEGLGKFPIPGGMYKGVTHMTAYQFIAHSFLPELRQATAEEIVRVAVSEATKSAPAGTPIGNIVMLALDQLSDQVAQAEEGMWRSKVEGRDPDHDQGR